MDTFSLHAIPGENSFQTRRFAPVSSFFLILMASPRYNRTMKTVQIKSILFTFGPRVMTCCASLLLIARLFPALPGEEVIWLRDEYGKKTGQIRTTDYFKEEMRLPGDIPKIIPPGVFFHLQAKALRDYIQKYTNREPFIQTLHAGAVSSLGVDFADVAATLEFIHEVITEDAQNKSNSRISDPRFIQKHFRFIRWYPLAMPGQPGKVGSREFIRLTKYAVFTIPGRLNREGAFNCALFRTPEQREFLSYTKQQVLSGIYNQGGATPLVWLTREGLEEALLEGTICVRLPDGAKRLYNVDQGNGVAYDPSLKDSRKQKRYWYFEQISQPQGYGPDVRSQTLLYPGAAAGDVFNLGLGKLLALEYTQPKTGERKLDFRLLADTGGAFSPNLKQLDIYIGLCDHRDEFRRAIAALPEHAAVYILILRREFHRQYPSGDAAKNHDAP